jgi:hypothetical protein
MPSLVPIWRPSFAACSTTSHLLRPHGLITALSPRHLRSHATFRPASARPCNALRRLPVSHHVPTPPSPHHCVAPTILPLIIIQSTTAVAQGCTPIFRAVGGNQTAALERLVQKGADIDAKTNVHARPRRAFAAYLLTQHSSTEYISNALSCTTCALSTNTAHAASPACLPDFRCGGLAPRHH